MGKRRAADWRSFGLIWAGSAVVVFAVFASCGGPQDQAGVNGDCFRADDCAEGLVCVEGKCTNDLSGIVSQLDAPSGTGAVAGAAGAAGMAAGGAAGTPAGGAAGTPAGGAAGTPAGGAAGTPAGGGAAGT